MATNRSETITENYANILSDIDKIGQKNQIREWMKKHLTFEQFRQYMQDMPELLLIHENTWKRYISGKFPIPFDVIKKLCVIFSFKNCQPSDLMFTPAEREIFEKFEIN